MIVPPLTVRNIAEDHGGNVVEEMMIGNDASYLACSGGAEIASIS
jgi:hypothetical protein